MVELAMTFGCIPGLMLICVAYFSGFEDKSIIEAWFNLGKSVKKAKKNTFGLWLLAFELFCLLVTDDLLLLILNFTAIIPSAILRIIGKKERVKEGYSVKQAAELLKKQKYIDQNQKKYSLYIWSAFLFWVLLSFLFKSLVPNIKITEVISKAVSLFFSII